VGVPEWPNGIRSRRIGLVPTKVQNKLSFKKINLEERKNVKVLAPAYFILEP